MRGTTRTVAFVAGISAVTLLAAACGGNGDDGGDNPSAALAARPAAPSRSAGATRRTRSSRRNTTETCGGNVLDAITAKLVHYNAETAAPENDIADKIETTDNQNFTVTLKKGYKFHDGTEVKSKNFVDAWNYAAYGPNAQSSGLLHGAHRGLRRHAVLRTVTTRARRQGRRPTSSPVWR